MLRSPLVRVAVLLVVLALVSIQAWRRQQEAVALKRSLQERAHRVATAERRVQEMEAELEPVRRELEALGRLRSENLAKAADLSGWLGGEKAASEETQPPALLPAWNPDSAFVWLPKDLLSRLPTPGFQADGSLQPELAAVLSLEPERARELDRRLAGVVAGYRAEELAHTHQVEAHLPGVAEQEGAKITVRVDPVPEAARRARAQFEETLVETLGGQRAEIVLALGSPWLGEQFNNLAKEPRTVSVVRREDGSFYISMQNGNGGMSSMSMSGSGGLENYIPERMRDLFAPVLEPDPLSPDPSR
ncbi:MAG: hypothetical protein IT580_23990 [Verrucomicrobiales bacterium]|nr:hypothetical protein [Verrucomicrobiales bacterium]